MKMREASDGWKSSPAHCPYCGEPLNLTELDMDTGEVGAHAPTPGMVAMCHVCAKASRINGVLQLEKIQPGEMLALLQGPNGKQLIAAHLLVQAAQKARQMGL